VVIHPDDAILPLPPAHMVIMAYAIVAWVEGRGDLPDITWWLRAWR
jgi:hypothetical protein